MHLARSGDGGWSGDSPEPLARFKPIYTKIMHESFFCKALESTNSSATLLVITSLKDSNTVINIRALLLVSLQRKSLHVKQFLYKFTLGFRAHQYSYSTNFVHIGKWYKRILDRIYKLSNNSFCNVKLKWIYNVQRLFIYFTFSELNIQGLFLN